jgi:hypothetical protein
MQSFIITITMRFHADGEETCISVLRIHPEYFTIRTYSYLCTQLMQKLLLSNFRDKYCQILSFLIFVLILRFPGIAIK